MNTQNVFEQLLPFLVPAEGSAEPKYLINPDYKVHLSLDGTSSEVLHIYKQEPKRPDTKEYFECICNQRQKIFWFSDEFVGQFFVFIKEGIIEKIIGPEPSA